MTLFWFLVAVLIAVAWVLLLPALLPGLFPGLLSGLWGRGQLAGAGAGTGPERQTNLSILRDQLVQLDEEFAAGSITAAQHVQVRQDIERRVLEEEGGAGERQPVVHRSHYAAIWVGLTLPVLALGLYGLLGNPQAIKTLQTANELAANAPGEAVSLAQIEAMVTQMAQRLENPPLGQAPDPAAWEMLARSYAALQRFPEADKAYRRASQLAPNNAQLLADHADVLSMLQGQRAAGEPNRLIERALQLDPKNLKALALAGSAAFERQDFASATTYWTQARQLAPPGSEFASGLERSLVEAQTAAGSPVVAPPAPGPLPAGGNQLSGVVTLSPQLLSRLKPDDTVFIFARAAQGPRMPLAILRRKASELPIRFTLDDSTAMAPELSLSRFAQVVVGARISRSGNAAPQSGDLTGQVGPVSNTSAALLVSIDSVLP